MQAGTDVMESVLYIKQIKINTFEIYLFSA